MHALSRERVEIGGQRGHQRLSLAGAHLGDTALVQHNAAQKLHAVVAQAEHAVGGLAHSGKGLGQNVVGRLSGSKARLEFVGLGAQLLIGQKTVGGVERLDLVGKGHELFELAVAVAAEQFIH